MAKDKNYNFASGGRSLSGGKGAFSGDFTESKVTGLDRDGYNPGPKANQYVSNAKGTLSINLSKPYKGYAPIDDVKPTSKLIDYDVPGMSGPVSRDRVDDHAKPGHDRGWNEGSKSKTQGSAAVPGSKKFSWS